MKITVCMIQEKGTISTLLPPDHVRFFFVHHAFSRQSSKCHVICCELLNGYSFTVSPNFVIVSGIMLNLENARTLSIYRLL